MAILAESAVRVTLLALGVAVVLRALRIRSPRLAHTAWTVVTVVMLLLPVFVAWGPRLAVPLLPTGTTPATFAPRGGDVASTKPEDGPITAAAAEGSQPGMSWATVAMAVYVGGVGILLLRLAMGLRRTRAMRRGGLQTKGRLTHPDCVTPMTVGLVTPAVILPADWADWDGAELSAVLAHEEEHVRRRDPFVTAVALFNRAIFWFHPLAWWLPREIVRLSEQACDAAVISRGHDRDVYSACLLRFARRAAEAGGRIVPMATAVSGPGLAERLGLLTRPQNPRPSGLRVACAAVACAAFVVLCAAAAPVAAPVQDGAPSAGGQAPWLVQTSEHFMIFHDGLPDERVSAAGREAEAAYNQLGAALKHDLSRSVPIILVRRDGDVAATDMQARNIVQQGGGPDPEHRVVISLESLDRRTGIVVHELTHVFAFEIIPGTSRAAPFLIEGFAEHQRGAWRAEDARLVRDAVSRGAIPSVAGLVASDSHWAHAVFDFVAARHGAEGLRQLLFALRKHVALVPAVPTAFGVTLDQFDQEFRGYVTTRFGQP